MPGKKVTGQEKKQETTPGLMRLNKFLSNAGIAARRKADELIKAGNVTVNGEIIREMGFKISASDVIHYKGKLVKINPKPVYILLNKPKDYITTNNDERSRKTVLDLISGATKDRIFPVGRLDRNTTGLLLLTNDGELAQKLSHPSGNVKKIYNVSLDKEFPETDIAELKNGVDLEDGRVQVDEAAYIDPANKKELGVMIHIGKNRIVRRIFEHLGYKIVKLDRVYYAGLTKKGLPRGKWRFLTEKEVILLKHFNNQG